MLWCVLTWVHQLGSVRLRLEVGTVRAVPVLGSGGSSGEAGFLYFSTVKQRGTVVVLVSVPEKRVPAVLVPLTLPVKTVPTVPVSGSHRFLSHAPCNLRRWVAICDSNSHFANGLSPVLPFLVFLQCLVFSSCEDFLVFLSVFPFFSRDFRGSVGITNPLFSLVVCRASFQKNKERKDREWAPSAGWMPHYLCDYPLDHDRTPSANGSAIAM